ncbi:hypothetical protein [Bacillus mycoides]|uniref:hypothetical protein n=1 Tax=Lysinibacillus sphaericus TaxID=1421 RepID=UPI001C5E9D9A
MYSIGNFMKLMELQEENNLLEAELNLLAENKVQPEMKQAIISLNDKLLRYMEAWGFKVQSRDNRFIASYKKGTISTEIIEDDTHSN